MNSKNEAEAARRARLLKMREERLPDIKRQFEENQKRNFNANFAPGGKDEALVKKTTRKASAAKTGAKSTAKKGAKTEKAKATKNAKGGAKQPVSKNVQLGVSVRKGEMVHHQRMLSQDVNAQATQHIIGVPVNKSRYNGADGKQLTMAQIRAARPHKDCVRVIPIGGLGEFGIGKNMTAIEYQGEIILIDMGTLFADSDYPGVNYMVPDSKWLDDNRDKVKAILFTHAHLDHIGACKHLLPYFGPLVPIYATEFTTGMIKKQMSEVPECPELNYQVVKPLEHKQIQLSQHLSAEFVHMLHSIPGNASIVIRTPNGPILLSGDWRFENNPMDTPADYDRLKEIADKEGFALILNESTNIDVPGTHPHSEYDVGDNIGKVMDNYATGRIIISCFSSQVKRIECVLKEAAERGRKVAFAGYSMINNVEVALRAKAIKVPKDVIMKMEDIIKLPDEKVTIVCTGSQGEMNAVLNRMVTGAHRYIKIKASDTIVFCSSPIPGNEPKVMGTVDGLLREGAQVIQHNKTHLTNIGPLHLSGHAYYEDHVK
ncbi:MBL fold metallo-hydrolase, partial [Candidatus Saccharibacteria bacterium]|nr:MBL fold metallo-hydrolase [Candidatus Saccharibacteria bacterium]